ncbi:MAG: arylesterase [Pseudomonadota bacterium]
MAAINFTKGPGIWFGLHARFQNGAVFAFALSLILAAFVVLAGSPTPSHAASKSTPPRIVVFGDSLVAGYQLGAEESFPVRLQKALDARGIAAVIIGAGVSGDTTSGGLARLNWSVPDDVDGVILELGANDALRGLPPQTTRDNLNSMITQLKVRDIDVLLTGMLAPPNLGETYAAAFNPIYAQLAKKHDILLYPFFLDGVAAVPELNQRDGIHPTAEGIDVIVERILPLVETFIARLKQRTS